MEIEINKVIPQLKNLLTNYTSREAEQLVYLIFDAVLQLNRTKIVAYPNTKISNSDYNQIVNIAQRLENNEPIQYILGETEFFGMNFKVNPSVLIPRNETEELVEWIIKETSFLAPVILDVGTGSGCIAISLAKNIEKSSVYAADISKGALDVAMQNAKLNGVVLNGILIDILSPDLQLLPNNIQVLVSNPPYVTYEQKKVMHKNVSDFEPSIALFVSDNDPLIFYRQIAHLGYYLLEDGGLLFFEINEIFGNETMQMLEQKGYRNIELRNDMHGKARMIKATK